MKYDVTQYTICNIQLDTIIYIFILLHTICYMSNITINYNAIQIMYHVSPRKIYYYIYAMYTAILYTLYYIDSPTTYFHLM